MLIGAEVNYQCLEPLQASLGVSKFDAFLVKRIFNDTNEVITEAELTAEFSDPEAMKEYNKLINYGVSFENDLASFFVKIIFFLVGLVGNELLNKSFDILSNQLFPDLDCLKKILVKYWPKKMQ